QPVGSQNAPPFFLGRDAADRLAVELQRLPPSAVGAVSPNKNGVQSVLARQIGDGISFGSANPLRSNIGAVLGENSTAAAVSGLENNDVIALVPKRAGRSQASQTSANHDDPLIR